MYKDDRNAGNRIRHQRDGDRRRRVRYHRRRGVVRLEPNERGRHGVVPDREVRESRRPVSPGRLGGRAARAATQRHRGPGEGSVRVAAADGHGEVAGRLCRRLEIQPRGVTRTARRVARRDVPPIRLPSRQRRRVVGAGRRGVHHQGTRSHVRHTQIVVRRPGHRAPAQPDRAAR